MNDDELLFRQWCAGDMTARDHLWARRVEKTVTHSLINRAANGEQWASEELLAQCFAGFDPRLCARILSFDLVTGMCKAHNKDRHVLRRARAGDSDAAKTLIDRHRKPVYAYARLRLDPLEAEVATTNAFTRLTTEDIGVPPDNLLPLLFKLVVESIAIEHRATGPRPSKVSRLFLNRYEPKILLGRGGMAEVYSGFDRHIVRNVAIKVFNAKTIENSLINDFMRGNRAVARLSHPFLASLFDIDVEDDVPFVVMELIQGDSLNKTIRSPLSWPRIAQIIRQICAGLGHLHKHGLIHGDLKPSNIVLTCQRSLKLIDFDLCMLRGKHKSIRRVGSLPWMSPEQIESGIRDPVGEIFSVGVILYQMLTGTLPFSAPGKDILTKICAIDYTPLSALVPELPGPIGRIVLRSLAPRKSRYRSLAALLEDVRATLGIPECRSWIRSVTPTTPPHAEDANFDDFVSNDPITFTTLTTKHEGSSPTGLHLFHDLLCSLFTFEEYRNFIMLGFAGNRLLEHLHEKQSYSGFVLQSLELLARRGLIDIAFFERLLDERPRRADEIADLALRLNLRL